MSRSPSHLGGTLSPDPAGASPALPAQPIADRTVRRRIILASTVGTTIEFYDFYAYATAAVAVFPHLFLSLIHI